MSGDRTYDRVVVQGIDAYRVQGPNARGPYHRFDDAHAFWYQGVCNKGRFPDWPESRLVRYTIDQLQGKVRHVRH